MLLFLRQDCRKLKNKKTAKLPYQKGNDKMRLIIAEKPELGRAVAEALFTHPADTKSVIAEGDTKVVWCFGHMLELRNPSEIDPELGQWEVETLPIAFPNWPKKIDPGKMERTKQIKELLEEASEVVNCGDPDDEGQLLVDELLEYFHYKGKVLRVLINDNMPVKIREAFSRLEGNEKYRKNGKAAYARQMADMCFGINHSRLAGIRLNRRGLSVGRVQTPTLGLVVNRDEAIEGHKREIYYDIEAYYDVNGKTAKYIYKPNDKEYPRVTNKEEANTIAGGMPQSFNLKFEEATKKTAPPLPYNLAVLQEDMNKRYGYSLKETLDITQKLRDNYKAITYNRSDSQYLNEEHYSEASEVLANALFNISKSYPLDYSIHSKCFNDTNVTAHHAIIPQNKNLDITRLTEKEKNVYVAIVERYAMQFLPPEVRSISKSTIKGKTGNLNYSQSQVIDMGFTKYFGNDEEIEENTDYIPSGQYPGHFIKNNITQKETKPKPRYTPASLVKDMTNIAKYVSDPEIKEILKKKDEGKKGENGSIGTSATRSDIVENLVKKGFLENKGKNIVSTQLGREFYHTLPESISKADTTAKWWLIQEDVRDGKAAVNDLMYSVVEEFNKIKEYAYKDSKLSDTGTFDNIIGICPLCGKKILYSRKKDNNGHNYYHEDFKNSQCELKIYDTAYHYQNKISMTPTKWKKLFEGGKIKEKLKKKDGGEYEAFLKMKINGKYINFEIDGFPRKK